jgi:hypothetical protein
MSQTHLIHSHITSETFPYHQGILCQEMAFLTFLVCAQNCLVTTVFTKALSCLIAKIIQAQNGMSFQSKSTGCWDILGPPQWGRGMCFPQGKGLPSISAGWNYPRQAPRLLEIRLLKTNRVTIEDTGMENCLSKVKFISAQGCAGTRAQQAWGVDHRSSFLFLTQLALLLYSDWSSSGAQSAHNWLMLHLEFGGGVGSNFSAKM